MKREQKFKPVVAIEPKWLEKSRKGRLGCFPYPDVNGDELLEKLRRYQNETKNGSVKESHG
jgi:hypothetical protein